MRRRRDFLLTVRGRRAGGRLLTGYLATGPEPDAPARVGFIVDRQLGSAVQRNLVTRRLRARVRGRLDRLPAGTGLVIRAKPAAATASSRDLDHDLDRLLDRLTAGAGG